MEDIIRTHQQQHLDANLIHRLTIRRNHIYADSLKAFKKGFPLSSHLRVVFLGEPAIDAGGPLKEYLTMLMKEVMLNNSLFTGLPECRGIVHSMKSLQAKYFYYVGQMIAVSILNGGPGPGCLSHAVVDYLTYGFKKVNATIEDVPNLAIQDHIKLVCLKVRTIL